MEDIDAPLFRAEADPSLLGNTKKHYLTMKLNTLITTAASIGLAMGAAQAASISINFIENGSNQQFGGGTNIGPLGTNSSNWNNTADRTSGSLAAGTQNDLKDDSGVITTTDITWSANGVFYTNQGTSGDENKLSIGYLDDGPTTAISITVTDIPYAQYRIYGLFASDKGNGGTTIQMLDFNVNNGTWAIGGAAADNTSSAYGNTNANNAANGEAWTEVGGNGAGNYWTVDGLTDSTLTIDGQLGSGNSDLRGSLAGIIIEEVPEPSSTALLGLGGLALILRRRK